MQLAVYMIFTIEILDTVFFDETADGNESVEVSYRNCRLLIEL